MKFRSSNKAAAFIAAFMTAAVIGTSAPTDISTGIAVTAYAAEEAAVPVPSVKAGKHYLSSNALTVKLSAPDPDAVLYYSRDGKKYYRYTNSVKIKESTTLRVYYKLDGKKSKVVKYKYTLIPKVNFSVPEGRYTSSQSIKLSSKVSGVEYYYTTDGSKPTKKSKKYTAPIKVTESCTLKVLVVKNGWKSRIISNEYVISDPNRSILNDPTAMYGYSRLDKNDREVYVKLFEAVTEQKSVDLTGMKLDSDKFDELIQQIGHDIGYLKYEVYYMRAKYDDDGYVQQVSASEDGFSKEKKDTLKKMAKAAEPIVKKALKESDTKQRVKVLHDELLKMTVYNYSYDLPEGPLLYGEALCEGYSRAFQYLCLSAGVPCVNVSGTGAGGAHMWNMVNIDGKWLHVDATFDDQKTISYEYFCVDDEFICQDHTLYDGMELYTPARFNIDMKLLEKEYKKWVNAVADNYKKGVTKTVFYTEPTLIGELLTRLGDLQNDLYERGINKQIWYSYYYGKITIDLR